VGQAEALIGAGIVPDLMVGTSAGSLNAAWLVTEPTPDGVAQLRSQWLEVRRRDVFPFTLRSVALGLLGHRDHTVGSAALERWIVRHLRYARLQDAPIPLTVTATDLDTGEAVYLTQGPTVPALLASCAVPGVFAPQVIDGRTLVDGGMSADAPIGQAVRGGADRVYVLPTLGAMATGRPSTVGDVVLRSISVVLGNARSGEIEAWTDRCEVFILPAPSVPGVSPFSFDHSLELMDKARALTEAWLPTARPLPDLTDAVARADGDGARRRSDGDTDQARQPTRS
jgi:NTE family protein